MLKYNKLFSLLALKGMKRTDLLGTITSPTLAKLGKGAYLNTDTIDKLCARLECQPGDIMEYVESEPGQPKKATKAPKPNIEPPKEKPKPKPKPAAEETIYFPLDSKLDQTFKDFIKMRKSLKNGAMTDKAISMMITKINKLDPDEAVAQMEQSIVSNWKDIYPIKDGFVGGQKKAPNEDFYKGLQGFLSQD